MSVAENQLLDVERIPWDQFLREHFAWSQGEHVALIGPTGCGKTTLALRLLPYRRYVAAFATKRKDETMDYLLTERHYRLIDEWPPPPQVERAVLWPRLPVTLRNVFRTPDTAELLAIQQEKFAEALDDLYWSGAWAPYVDEAWYIDVYLGLRKKLNLLLGAGRSGGVSMVMGTQRPVNVTRSMFSESTHLFLWRLTDMSDRKRLLEISGGVDKRFIMHAVAKLSKHDVFYVNTRLGTMVTTRVEL